MAKALYEETEGWGLGSINVQLGVGNSTLTTRTRLQ